MRRSRLEIRLKRRRPQRTLSRRNRTQCSPYWTEVREPLFEVIATIKHRVERDLRTELEARAKGTRIWLLTHVRVAERIHQLITHMGWTRKREGNEARSRCEQRSRIRPTRAQCRAPSRSSGPRVACRVTAQISPGRDDFVSQPTGCGPCPPLWVRTERQNCPTTAAPPGTGVITRSRRIRRGISRPLAIPTAPPTTTSESQWRSAAMRRYSVDSDSAMPVPQT